MSRLSALSIVLALAIGPDAAAICGLWCTDQVTTQSCDHGTPDSPRIAAGDCCDDVAQAVAVVQAAVRFDASSSNGAPALSPVRNPLVDSARLARPHHVSGFRPSTDARPQTTVLRI
jgi:hypothetical protein